jgi:uncharacterized membrane protein YkvA (DUF1232 family)/uncharacterized membrane protein (DUF2068 family)
VARWLELVAVALAVMVAVWALLVVLAARLPAGLLKDLAGFLPACVTLVRRLRRDPRVPWRAKAAVVAAGLWVLSPVDLLPEFLPVVGPLDDVVVVALALRYAARRVPHEVLLEAWPGDPRLLERLIGPPATSGGDDHAGRHGQGAGVAAPDSERTRFRRPLGLAVIAYKAALGLSELLVGALLASPSFDPQAAFARLAAEELREDPGDRTVALLSRHLPALLHHRGLVAVALVLLGLAKLVAAGAMWQGKEWGGYLLGATVALLLPFDVRQAVVDPTAGHALLAVANLAALLALVLLLRGRLPGRPRTPAHRT